ncbi:hypothetical protein FIBSPDRAFT_864128 [Athelia psychrophila]|uniref:Uncharacterized protein n=1 Tax=Athelia psychrophila TaxID=1759441 RepID=A0A166GUH6_9AGAM|nr:hypothetical protein FIBSPDRAFT_1047165 [Fibularhizoctonia sp. CBS 109695]KZP18178.1 hypothetical protein FIBSPDRAFT_864128 [Fibularhizoctonia sp. CBS 109695]
MSATTRSFAVFLDTPAADPVKPRLSDPSPSQPHNALSVSDLLSPSSTSATAAKENLHPVTGESTTSSKKRKTSSVLATKVINPPTSKKQKESSSSVVKPKSESKKRKSSISASASSPLKPKAKAAASDKEVKRTVLGVAAKKKASGGSSRVSKRKVLPLPKLEEEGAEAVEGMTQADVDSRCYELTVLPLADVTQAYDSSPSMDYLPLGEEPAKAISSRALRAKSSEPDLRDCYTPSSSMPSLTHSQSSSASKRASSMPPVSSVEEEDAKTFSTPERKQIYAAFTFSSPSPTGARFGLTRSTSVDALRFIADA